MCIQEKWLNLDKNNILYGILTIPILTPSSMITLAMSSLSITVGVTVSSPAVPEEGRWVWSSPKAPGPEICHDLNCLAAP